MTMTLQELLLPRFVFVDKSVDDAGVPSGIKDSPFVDRQDAASNFRVQPPGPIERETLIHIRNERANFFWILLL